MPKEHMKAQGVYWLSQCLDLNPSLQAFTVNVSKNSNIGRGNTPQSLFIHP